MSRKLVFILFTFILLSSLLCIGLTPVVESYKRYPVWNDSTGLTYTTIQEAINDCKTLNGHNLSLNTYTVYYENVVVNKSINLYGAFYLGHPESIPIINGKGTGAAVTIEADNVTIGWWIDVTNGINGICVEDVDNCILNRLSITNNSETGIYLHNSKNCTIRSCSITGNRYNFGVEGSSAEHYFHKVISSTTNGKPIRYLTNEQDKNITEDSGYIAAINCTNITVENQDLTNNHQGLLFVYTNNSIIRNSNISNNLYGIYLQHSSNNRIYHNFINNTYQVHVEKIGGYPSNSWDDDYPSGGNYWSDYKDKYPDAAEIGNSGIWDIPYVINENSLDNYPIVPEFPSFLVLPLFMMATLLTLIIYRCAHDKQFLNNSEI